MSPSCANRDDHDTRIDADNAVVEVTRSFTVGVGRHRCACCGEWTPRPSQDELRKFVERTPGDHFIWPFDDWWPAGWIQIAGAHAAHTYCPTCADRVASVVKPVKDLAP